MDFFCFILLFGRFAVWAGACVCFCCLGGGGGRGGGGEGGGEERGGGGRLFFAVWAGGVVFFVLLFGGGREFTHLPVCLARLQATQQHKRPNCKKTRTGSSYMVYTLGQRGPPIAFWVPKYIDTIQLHGPFGSTTLAGKCSRLFLNDLQQSATVHQVVDFRKKCCREGGGDRER